MQSEHNWFIILCVVYSKHLEVKIRSCMPDLRLESSVFKKKLMNTAEKLLHSSDKARGLHCLQARCAYMFFI